ncbi:Diphthamide biosynthesis protein 3 [Coniosporium uncinatum]|uniref:Diphthamide biosynthesis protein 3 n=1 Tax=Coniosporium uncinatum TaxID=93489 RepID=A0ACC3D9S7_9PEZI|nr:Diphthamide biosynthesis protein 3 [Coniosporium uncinatum]
MTESFYDEIEIEDMTYDKTLQIYHYPCPCGDRFEIGIADLRDGEEVAVCPSCSLMIKVIFDAVGIWYAGDWRYGRLIWLMQADLPKEEETKQQSAKEAQKPVSVAAA